MLEVNVSNINGVLAGVRTGTVKNDDAGLVVYSADYREYNGAAFALTDENGSAEMAVDASIGGTPIPVYADDPTTNWTNTALGGTWDFASAAVTVQSGTECIDATATRNGDSALMEKSATVAMGSYAAISGYIYLTKYSASNNRVDLQLRLAGVNVGVTVNIGDYIDTGLLNVWQHFVILKSEFGITAETIDQLLFTTIKIGGKEPDYYLDTINIEETGGKLFTVEIPEDLTFELYSINYMFRDNITTLEPNQIMGVAALTNGIVVRTELSGRVSFSAGIKTFAELLAAGARLDSQIIGATESAVNFISDSPAWTRLKGDNGDKFSFSITDDLSGLSSFRAILRGRILL